MFLVAYSAALYFRLFARYRVYLSKCLMLRNYRMTSTSTLSTGLHRIYSASALVHVSICGVLVQVRWL